jgi:hypothetical protein
MNHCVTRKTRSASERPLGTACYLSRVCHRTILARCCLGLALLAPLVLARAARAEVLHLPIGGRPAQLPDGRVLCEAPGHGFAAEPGSRTVRPPVNQENVGTSVDVKVAPTQQACGESTATTTLVATARQPNVEPESIWLASDEGRLDARGEHLRGASVVWQSEGKSGIDTCHDPRPVGARIECSWSVERGFSVSPEVTRFYLLPAGARTIEGAAFFDLQGRRVNLESMRIVPARITLLRIIPPDASVDLSTGQGEIPLVHPEAVAAADCGALNCEMLGGKLVVRGGSSMLNSLEVKLRLVPHVFVFRRDNFESAVSARLPVMHCPMSVVSGEPIRGNDETKLIVRLEGRCGAEVGSLRFTTPERALKVLDIVRGESAAFAVLDVGSLRDESITIHAERGQPEGIVIASVSAPTRPAPPVRASLELAGHTNLGFLPTNRPALVHASPAGDKLRFQLLPIDGVYEVTEAAAGQLIQADPNAAGLTSLRFGLRATNLPERLNKVDLAVVTEPLQRGTGPANLPVPIEPVEGRPKPLVEVWCGGGREPLREVEIGIASHLPFKLRDTCRVVFHRELLPPEYGTQKFNFEIDVVRPDGSSKPQGHVSEVVTLRAGEAPRYAWIAGATEPFDRVTVRVSHVADENHYVGAEEVRTGAPSAQWTFVLGTGHVRLYGTTTIPTGLYRFSTTPRYSGVMVLNFGVLSRLTWLDDEGREGLLGAEAGVLIFGLANSASGSKQLTQVGAVLGLGFAVPITGRSGVAQAAVNVHGWFQVNLSAVEDAKESARYGFVFGPSLTIGNVGVNL